MFFLLKICLRARCSHQKSHIWLASHRFPTPGIQYVSVCIQVKELYQGVLGKLQLLHPRLISEERMGESYERMRREVEREVVRRKTLASQLRTLLDSQLEVDIKFLTMFFPLLAVCFKSNKSKRQGKVKE